MTENQSPFVVKDKRIQHEENLPTAPVQSSIVMMAMQKGYDPALIEKMMELEEKRFREEARRAFYEAVADFKKNPPEVLKDKENSQFSRGDKKAMYSSLGNLVKAVNPALGSHGLSASWELAQTDKMIKVTCRLAHRMGHTEAVTLEGPPDDSGGNAKNAIQKIKSTITYLRAATFEAVTGIAATDEANLDDDGNGAVEYITSEQVKQLIDIIIEKSVDAPKFLGYMAVETVDTIPAKQFGKALTALKKAKGGTA